MKFLVNIRKPFEIKFRSFLILLKQHGVFEKQNLWTEEPSRNRNRILLTPKVAARKLCRKLTNRIWSRLSERFSNQTAKLGYFFLGTMSFLTTKSDFFQLLCSKSDLNRNACVLLKRNREALTDALKRFQMVNCGL